MNCIFCEKEMCDYHLEKEEKMNPYKRIFIEPDEMRSDTKVVFDWPNELTSMILSGKSGETENPVTRKSRTGVNPIAQHYCSYSEVR